MLAPHPRRASLTVGDGRRTMTGNVELGRQRWLSGMDRPSHSMPSLLLVAIDLWVRRRIRRLQGAQAREGQDVDTPGRTSIVG
jgi:hypothetical protein